MKEKLYDEIVITKDTWGDEPAQRLGYTIMTRLGEDEVCKVYDDDNGIYIIQHNHNEDHEYWGCPVCEWITDEEKEAIDATRAYAEDSENGAEQEDEEPTFGTVAAEFYFEASQLLDKYQSAQMSADETLQRLISILDKARSETEDKSGEFDD